jgi:glycosyltransferase involved in cell wall biosynthesis
MKITIVTSFPFPEGKATANRVKVFARELIRTNFIDEVVIIATSPNKDETFFYESSIKVINIQISKINKNRLLLRVYKEIGFAFKIWATVRKSQSNNIIITIPSVLLLLPIILYPKKHFFALDIRDAVWTYFSSSPFGFIFKALLEGLFRIAAKKADIVSVTNSEEAIGLRKIAGIEPIIIANGISKKEINIYKNIPIKPIKGLVNLTYIGNVGIAQELDVLIELAKLNQASLEISIIGDGARLDFLRDSCMKKGISNIKFHGNIPQNDVAHFMGEADILFAQIGKNYASAVPTKVFEYIASGRKVLLGLPDGPAKNIFSKFSGIEIFEVGDFSDMLESYRKLLNIDFNDRSRFKNLSILESKYLREKTISMYINEIRAIFTCSH